VRREPHLRSWFLDRWWPLSEWPESPRTVSGFVPVDREAAAHPRRVPAIGLTAEYDFGTKTVTRHEPYPLFAFLTPTFDRQFTAHFRGRLRVPPTATGSPSTQTAHGRCASTAARSDRTTR
jgi:hypothetical protein